MSATLTRRDGLFFFTSPQERDLPFCQAHKQQGCTLARMQEMSVVATVPGGQSQGVNVNGQQMMVTVPPGVMPGQNFSCVPTDERPRAPHEL